VVLSSRNLPLNPTSIGLTFNSLVHLPITSCVTMADKTLTADQARLLTEVVARTAPALKPHEWNDVAGKLGIGNGKAA